MLLLTSEDTKNYRKLEPILYPFQAKNIYVTIFFLLIFLSKIKIIMLFNISNYLDII